MAKFANIDISDASNPMHSVGITGGTGTPGGIPSMELLSSPASTPALTAGYMSGEDDPMHHMVKHFQGSTGAMGGTVEPNVQIENGKPIPQDTLVRVAENTTDQIEKLNKEETLLQLKSQNKAAEAVFGAARSKMINIGYVIGCLLVHYKKLVLTEGENWGDAIRENLPEMSRRTIDKYSNIANTPGILKHAYLGIDAAEQLIQAIKPIKHMLSKEDPIGDLFERNGITLNYAQLDKSTLSTLVRGVITRQKLLQKEIEVDIEITTDFGKVAGAVTAIDIAVMLDRKEHGGSPEEYMREVIANNGVRPNDASENKDSKQPIRYINAETIKLKNSIDRLLEDNVDLKKVDKTHLEALRTAVDNLLEKYTN